nr:IS66 family insertion sequence element accessory protein TnpB [Duganella sp. Root198D2]
MQLQANSVWLATPPVDIRAGIDRLSLYVQQALGKAPCDGTAYVFSNRRQTRLKVVCWMATACGCGFVACIVASSSGRKPVTQRGN